MIDFKSNKYGNYKLRGSTIARFSNRPLLKSYAPKAFKPYTTTELDAQVEIYTSLPQSSLNNININSPLLNLSTQLPPRVYGSTIQSYTQLLIWCISARIILLSNHFSTMGSGTQGMPYLSMTKQTLEAIRSGLKYGKLRITLEPKVVLHFKPCLEITKVRHLMDSLNKCFAPVSQQSQFILVAGRNRIHKDSEKLSHSKSVPSGTIVAPVQNSSVSGEDEDISRMVASLGKHIKSLKRAYSILCRKIEGETIHKLPHNYNRYFEVLKDEIIYPPSSGSLK